MTYTPLRIDFVDPGAICTRTGGNGRHGFKTSTAYILLNNENGFEQPFGPKCAEHVLGGREALRGIPDFTTRDFTSESGEGDQGTGGGSGGGLGGLGASDIEKARAFAKRYLMLRMERVADIPGIQSGIKYPPLAKIYAEFQQARELSDDDVRHIIALEMSPKTPAVYRSNNLLDVYTAYVQINRLIKTVKPGGYLDTLVSIRDETLLKRLKLSGGQINVAKLKLHPKAFQG